MIEAELASALLPLRPALHPVLGLFDVGPLELLVVTVAAIIMFGGDLPDMARRAGQLLGRLRSAAHELTRQIEPPADLTRLPEPDDAMHRPPPTTPSSRPSLQPPPTTPAPSLQPPPAPEPPDTTGPSSST